MAILRLRNNTEYRLNVPVIDVAIDPNLTKDVVLLDIDSFYNDPRIQNLRRGARPKLTVQLVQDSTPGAEGDAVLPFFATVDLPPATDNPGMMVYNTVNDQVQVSDGTTWLGVSTLLIVSGALPAPTSLPSGYIVFSKDDQAIYVNGGSAWLATQANGIRSKLSHQIPPAGTVLRGAMYFNIDSGSLQISDGTNWQLINNVQDYSTIAGLPKVTDVGFGALAYTSRDSTIWIRVGSNWQTTTGIVRYYATYAALPTSATWGGDEKGAIAYIDDDQCIVVWDGKHWRYPAQLRDYKSADLPKATDYTDGHMILNGDVYQPLIAWAGDWKGITPVARPYAAGVRPANADCKEGTMIWNSTSNKANFNIGGQWVDANGTPDP